MDSFHIKSMTAFGSGVADSVFGRFTVEIQSVNRRFLELTINLPRLFNRFEMDLRKQLTATIGRGMVTLNVTWRSFAKQPISVNPNWSLALALKNGWEILAEKLKLSPEVPLPLLTQQKDLFLFEEELNDEELYLEALLAALNQALARLLTMKEGEGQTLAKDLEFRLQNLTQALAFIERHTGQAVDKYRQKLQSRLEELFSGHVENEDKILREIAIYAERVDITEEVIRFKSHLQQFGQMLHKPLEQVTDTRGKMLDFLLQELLRECNTMGSKTADFAIAQQVVTIKSELEKIKEQVQNIE